MPDLEQRTYFHTFLEFRNQVNIKPWPMEIAGVSKFKNHILLAVKEDGKIICGVDLNGNVRIEKGRTGEDVIRLIALILGYPKTEREKEVLLWRAKSGEAQNEPGR